MFEFLKEIDLKLYKRYLTLEKNIESKSNSFYDSWLDLAEHFSKLVAKNEGITIDAKYDTMVGILAQKEYESFYKNMGISIDDYQELFDLAKAVNAHKHRDETDIVLTDVIKHLKALFNYSGLYYKTKLNGRLSGFNENYYVDLFGKTEKDLRKLHEDKEKLIESLTNLTEGKEILSKDLERVKEIAKRKESAANSLEEEKELLLKEVNELKDIKLTTLEEKVSRIVAILERQTYALEKVGSQLEYAASINFGQSYVHSVTIGMAEAARRLNGYDRYVAFKLFKEQNEMKFLAFLKENEDKTFTIDGTNSSFRYKLKKNSVVFNFKETRRSALETFELPIQMLLFNLGEHLENRKNTQGKIVLTLAKASGCYPINPREDELVELFISR